MPKRKSFLFPYQARFEGDGTVKVFPVARTLVERGGKTHASLFMVIDSGAVISALPKSDDELFGIRAQDGVPMRVSGIGGPAQVSCSRSLRIFWQPRVLNVTDRGSQKTKNRQGGGPVQQQSCIRDKFFGRVRK